MRSPLSVVLFSFILGVSTAHAQQNLLSDSASGGGFPPNLRPIILTIDGIDLAASQELQALFGLLIKGRADSYLEPAIKRAWDFVDDEDVHYAPWSGNYADTPKFIESVKAMTSLLTQMARRENKPFVIVAHSWGSVLAYRAIDELYRDGKLEKDEVDQLVTLGSPLNSRNLVYRTKVHQYIDWRSAPAMEELVREWRNYWIEQDGVSNRIPELGEKNIQLPYSQNRDGKAHSAYYNYDKSPLLWNTIGLDIRNALKQREAIVAAKEKLTPDGAKDPEVLFEGVRKDAQPGHENASGRIVNEAEGPWQTIQGNCKFHSNVRKMAAAETNILWSGDCVDGKLHGIGTLKVYRKNNPTVLREDIYFFNGIPVGSSECFNYWTDWNPFIKLLPYGDILVKIGKHRSTGTEFWLQVLQPHRSDTNKWCTPNWGDMYAVLSSSVGTERFDNTDLAEELKNEATRAVKQQSDKVPTNPINRTLGKPSFRVMNIVPHNYRIKRSELKRSFLYPRYVQFPKISKLDAEKKEQLRLAEEAKRQHEAEEKRLQKLQRKQAEICLPGNPKGDTRWLVQEHTEAAAKMILSNSIFCQSDDLIRLRLFDKTDGQSREEFGVKFYKLTYEAEIEFLRFVWWSGAKQSIFYNNFEVKTRGIISSGETRNAGERQNISGVIRFEKTERGWWGEPGRIKLIQ